MKDTPIIILGGGGHAKVLIELIKLLKSFKLIGIVDPFLEKNSELEGIKILGGDEILEDIFKEGVKMACIGVGSVKDTAKRALLYKKCKEIGFNLPYLVHPTAYVSKKVVISDGSQIMAKAIIQTNSFIGENVVINSGSIVEHDCTIENHVFIAPGVVISGGCIIGEGAFIGSGATIIQGIKIGKKAIIGAGAVVINDVSDGVIVKGIPAR